MYRLYKRFHARQADIRTMLYHHTPPPDTPSSDPTRQTIDHLQATFLHSDCPISDFQHRFQKSFL
jgi:hypothetical protein